MKPTIALVAALAASPAWAQERPTKPERAAVAAFVKSRLNDPESVRNATISQWFPATERVRRHVCIRFNAKNQYGGFSGDEDMFVFFDSGTPSTLTPDRFGGCRAAAAYQPFPEMARR